MYINADCFEEDNNLIIQRFCQGIKLTNGSENSLSSDIISLNKIYNTPLCIYFLDSKGCLLSANEADLKAINAASMQDVAGLTVRELARKETAEKYTQQDREVLATKMMIIKEEPFTRLDDITVPFITIKFPLYGMDNTLKGVFGISLFTHNDNEYGISLAESLSLLSQTGILQIKQAKYNQFLPGMIFDDIYFTKQEKIISHQLIRGKTAKEIADILGRSRRTIEKHLANMKTKTNSASKSELIEKIVDKLLIK